MNPEGGLSVTYGADCSRVLVRESAYSVVVLLTPLKALHAFSNLDQNKEKRPPFGRSTSIGRRVFYVWPDVHG